MQVLGAPPWRRDEPLALKTSFQIGGKAAFFSEPARLEDLTVALAEARARNLPVAVLGRGCNTLVLDEGFPGLMLSLARFQPGGLEIESSGAPASREVRVSAGMPLSHFSRELGRLGLSGLEFLSQIPGTVGGALRMNAGFSRTQDRSQCISRCVKRVHVVDFEGHAEVLERSEIAWGYRSSGLDNSIVLDAVFSLNLSNPELVKREMLDNYTYRASVQDLRYPCAGSIYKNPDPPAQSVGRMVEALGLKGSRIGGAQISDRHGNFIVNRGGARARDVLRLCDLIERSVEDAYGISLEKEIRIVGPSLS